MNFIRYAVCSAILCGMALVACSSEEEPAVEVAPAPKVVNQPASVPAAEVKPVADEDPMLQPMVAPAQEQVSAAPATPVAQSESGSYVLQVGIQPSKKGANNVIAKLAEKGVTAYLSEVENPGELEGTYYRVRVGYFATIHDAQAFGKNVLEPAGFPWWVDNRANDGVGNPTSDDNTGTTTYSSYEPVQESAPVYSALANEPAPEETPVEAAPMEAAEGSVDAAPVEQAPAAPVQETAPVAEPAPAAEAPAAPAAPTASSEDDIWD